MWLNYLRYCRWLAIKTAASVGSRKFFKIVVGARGFEPPTSRSQTERTTRLCYAPTINLQIFSETSVRLLSTAREYTTMTRERKGLSLNLLPLTDLDEDLNRIGSLARTIFVAHLTAYLSRLRSIIFIT